MHAPPERPHQSAISYLATDDLPWLDAIVVLCTVCITYLIFGFELNSF